MACLLVLTFAAPDPVRSAANKAAVLVADGRYDEARATLDAAESKQADPVFVFMRGVVEEEQGNCEAAVIHYDRFLNLQIPDVDAKEAQRRRQRCLRLLEARPVGPVVAAPVVVQPAEPRTPDPPRRWYADPAGVAFSGLGFVGLAAGAGVYAKARSDARVARSAVGIGLYDSRATRAERWSRAGVASMAVGGAFVVAAVVRYAIVAAKSKRTHANFTGTLGRFR